MDLREYPIDWEEMIRTSFAGLMASRWHAMPVQVTEDSPDGHNATVQVVIKRMVTDIDTGARTFESHPVHPDSIVHFVGGAGAALTHGIKKNDNGLAIYADRNVDAFRQSGGEQQPVDDRMSGYQDPHYLGSIRSDPNKIQQVAPDAMHMRDDAKHAVHEMKPGTGVRSFHADPSTAPASENFDPLSMAVKYVQHLSQSSMGAIGQAVDGGDVHDHGSHHGVGSWVQSFSGKHKVIAGLAGALLSAFDGDHKVNADESGVQVTSKKAVSISAPPGMLSLAGMAAGSVGGAALGAGAASANIGPLLGDLSGSLPSPEVVGLHVDFSQYPAAANDAAAAAAGVPVGGLYRCTLFVQAGSVSSSGGSSGPSSTTLPASGLSVLVVRMA